ncbi:acyltransferase family protein [Geodermatophilus sp. SYSU D00697]
MAPTTSAPVAPRHDLLPGRSGSAGRLRALDGLRLFAALWVAIYHYLGQDHGKPPWGQWAATIFPDWDVLAPYGWLGVEIFFIISGFAICMSCWGRSLGDFFRSRVTRLFPAYWVGIVLTFVVSSLAPQVTDAPTVWEAAVNLTMLQDGLQVPRVDPVYWTLWFELKFYLLFAVVVWMGLTYKRVIGFCLLWTVGGVVASGADSPLLNMVFMPTYNAYFLLGIGLYLVHRFGNSLLTWLVIGANLAMALYRGALKTHDQEVVRVHQEMHAWVTAAALLLAVALVYAIARGHLSWVRWNWVTKAGALTYPFYLLHLSIGYAIINWLYVGAGLSAHVVLPATLGAILGLSWLVHRFVEKPLAKVLKRHLTDGRMLTPRDLLAGPAAGDAARSGAAGSLPIHASARTQRIRSVGIPAQTMTRARHQDELTTAGH